MNIEEFKQIFPLPDNWVNTALLFLLFGIVPFTLSSITPLSRLCSTLSEFRNRKILTDRLSRGSYDKETIQQSTKYYISPKCSNIDPAQEEEMRQALMATKESLFDKIDYFIDHDSSKRHLLVLADSGTGKTSFVLNYYAYNVRRRGRKSQNLFLVHLGFKDADTQVRDFENKSETVIFLDALDEDTKAIEDHRMRIRDLMEICRDYKRVIITCRTQFFPNEEEMPVETGIARLGPRKAGEKGVYEFWKLYLSPFDDSDIDLYLQKRFPFWRSSKRQKSKDLAYRIKSLSARPMLLAHIPDILNSDTSITQSCQLYQLMVDAWLERESSWVSKGDLREYSERLSVNLYVNRERRGMERVPFQDLQRLAHEWNIDLRQWQLSGRSLLNRDAQGNYKFAHRSIMEYLFVNRLLQRDIDCSGIILTDQMKQFLIERISTNVDNVAIHMDLNRALKFLFAAEVFVDFLDKSNLEKNGDSITHQLTTDNELDGVTSSKQDFLDQLNKTSRHIFFLYHILPVFPPFPRAIARYEDFGLLGGLDSDRLIEFVESLNGIQISQESGPDRLVIDPSDSYIKNLFYLISMNLHERDFAPTVSQFRRLQRYPIGPRITLGNIKYIEFQGGEEIREEVGSQTEIHHDVRRFIGLHGIRGLISYYLINQSSFCTIEPVLPSLNQFALRLKLEA